MGLCLLRISIDAVSMLETFKLILAHHLPVKNKRKNILYYNKA